MLNTIEVIELIKGRNKAIKELKEAKKLFTISKSLNDLVKYREAQAIYQSYYPKIYTLDVCTELFGILVGTVKPVIIDSTDSGDVLLGKIDRDGMVSLSVAVNESHTE